MPITPTHETIHSRPAPEEPLAKIPKSDAATLEEVERDMNRFIAQVFGWIAGALMLSAFFASYSDGVDIEVPTFISVHVLFFIAGGMLLGAYVVSRTVGNMSTSVAIATLAAYSSLQGALFGLIYRLAYNGSLVPAYLVMAVLFALLCSYGMKTQRDLISFSGLLIAAGLALVLATTAKVLCGVHLLTASATCACSWLILSLAAYHRDFLRNLPASFDDDAAWHKAAAIGALQIYLNVMIVLVVVLQARWLQSSVAQLTGKEPKN